MHFGQVKFYDRARGFGFVTRSDGGGEIFVGSRTLAECGYDDLEPGALVNFEIETDKRDRKFISVIRKVGAVPPVGVFR